MAPANALSDYCVSRVRLNSEARDRGGAAIDEVAEIVAAVLDRKSTV